MSDLYGSKGPRVFNFRLKLPGIVAIAVLLLGGFVWVFILGIMVGRKQLEAENSALSAMVPVRAVQQQAQAGAAGPSQEELNKLFEENNLVQSEDLEFKEELRSPAQQPPAQAAARQAITQPRPAQAPAAPVASTPAPAPRPAAQQPAARPAAQPAPQASGQASGQAYAQTPARPAVTSSGAGEITSSRFAAQQQAAPYAPANPGAPVFEYMYQVASFNQIDQAENLIRRISSAGIPAELEVSQTGNITRYRVLVFFKGSPEQTGEFLVRLGQFRLGEPLLRKRTRAE
ncbi:SPOR domain-containing protein [Desulfovibrio sp. OttesenSCG-928-C14]|nr:SPOR domain-containing protein [Desulfovibrio sp. OttesenSCG-928-C14]